MKVVNLRQAILQAWKERWTDYQWAINMKKLFPKGPTWDLLGLSDHLLEQALVGPSPNPLIMSYLKYAISSQMVSYASVMSAIAKFEDYSRELCVKALLELMDMFCDRLSCHGKAEECISLCRSLLSTLAWLLRCAAYCTEKLKEGSDGTYGEEQLELCMNQIEKTVSKRKNRALLHIARLEEQVTWTNLEQALIKLTENHNKISNQQLRLRLEECIGLVKSIPVITAQSEQNTKMEFPTVHTLIMLEGTLNLTSDTQSLVEQLIMVKRMQRIPSPLFLLEIWKACFVGLIESPEGTEELKWTAFTFLKIPQALLKLKKCPLGDKDFAEDVNTAFEFLLKLTPLLDKADQRCNCDCVSLLLQECGKLGLLSESNMKNLVNKRTADRELAPRLKSAENASIQPNPGLILRAEPTVTNILKTMDADHSKSPEGLLGVLGHMLSGKSLDLLLAAAAATGKLKSFARKFVKLNEFAKHISGEGSKAASVRALLFDISFLMLCHVAQTYGSDVILSEPSTSGEVVFFETWMLTCMPEEGKILNPEQGFRADPTKVESLVAHLNSSTEMKLVQVKWHEVCSCTPAAILEVLNAWEHGLLTFEAVQKITDNIKGKICSMAICAVAWLVAHVRMLGLEEREKPLQMICQLVTPLYAENTLQFYNERVVIMSLILEQMCADVLQQTATSIKFPSANLDPIPYRNLLPVKKPIKEVLITNFNDILNKGWVDSRSIHVFEALLHMGGVYWFCNNLIKTRSAPSSGTLPTLALLPALTLSSHLLCSLVWDSAHTHSAPWSDTRPTLALLPALTLSVWCALSAHSSHNKNQATAKQRKRHREDIEDYINLFPLDDSQPSKLLRLLSSNEEDPNILSSPGDRTMSSSLSASQLHNINMRDPLNRVLANLFLLISSILSSKVAGPHTQFVQWFMEECVECLDQGSRGSVLQFMPFTMVSELVKLPAMSKPKTVLAITDLGLPLGRRVAAKAIAAL
ncbi:mediator of RNA polymerase II transcription subunit 24 [Chiloscyllium plagiosum]|uniref:mediator of RNA polymerase II transcription subunit 24 n=1 Tax=Chiloscyllium plagiosum TaxID=36176 RepID=UPI001CB7F2B6|nr:mediator of RNA polymerase II transcription subunit 24 [Chiloscyllium plagiosum]